MGNKLVGKVCVVRINKSGVHVGTVVSITRQSITLKNYIRLWSWSDALCVDSIAAAGCVPNKYARGTYKVIDREEGGEVILATEECVQKLNQYK